jgi:tetratricopeptide (TPR) repeat protein
MYNEAYFDYCYMIRLQPEDGSIYCSRGLCLAKLKKYTMAYEDLDNAIDMEPTNPNHYFGRSNLYAECGKHDSAVEGTQREHLLPFPNKSLTLSIDLTKALYELDHLANIGAHSPANMELRLKCGYRRACSYFELKQYEKVVQDLNDVLSQDPNSIPARALLGKALKVMSDFKRAEEQLTIAISLDNNMATLYTGDPLSSLSTT